MERPKIFNILIDEVFTPFYLFQYFSLTVWIYQEYLNYSYAIIITTLLSIFSEISDTVINTNKIRMMALYTCEIEAMREGKMVTLTSDELVPGDLVIMPTGAVQVPCDLVIIQG